ncbi:MAG: outer membrane beta-barrel family protein [Bacteroidota bacterium]
MIPKNRFSEFCTSARWVLPAWLILMASTVSAQADLFRFSGRVIDAESQQPIEFATVMMLTVLDDQSLGGNTTDADGRFTLEVNRSDVYFQVSFIGYETIEIRDFEQGNRRVDLGDIQMGVSQAMLEEVVVEASRSQVTFELDKRVFNVGEDLSSTGASALEVLNNVPSVNVNIEGEISLRGSNGVQILINGKPSVLAADGGNALGTITADMIESIEVITNPSAKYEAEGTAGIINIIIKKDDRRGLNGAVSVNTGTPHNHSVGLSLNRRSEKFNLFSQLGVGYRELPNETESINRSLIDGSEVASDGEEFRNEQFYNLVLGTDYYINDKNVITISGNFAYEVEDQPSSFNFIQTDGTGSTIAEWRRTEETEATNPKWQYEAQYKRDFEGDEGHSLLFSAVGSFFGKDQRSNFINEGISGADRDARQRTRTNFSEAENTLRLDYNRPLSEKWSMETGALLTINDVTNDFAVEDLVGTEFVIDTTQTNIFEYHQDVLGVYGTLAYEGEQWGVKAGLRVESTNLETFLVNTQATNDQDFTNLFPSAFVSYKLTEAISFQAGYSRRIDRPNLWDLNPFFNIRNNFNIRAGNPDLLPEFTDSYEFNSIYILGQASLNLGIYHRYTTEVVDRITTFDNNVSLTRPFNIGTNATTGLELNGKLIVGKLLVFNGDFNFSTFTREGEFEEQNFNFTADQWSSRLNSKLKLPNDLDMELTGRYQSAVQTVQGRISANWTLDFGLRKSLFDGRGAINFSVRDIFATRIREVFVDQDDFTAYSFGLRGRFITLGFSYGFGKGDTMEYSGQRRRF